jgi:hypothetical protein
MRTPLSKVLRLLFLLIPSSVLLLTFSPAASAQEREDRTLLPWDRLRAIISESSGERAMHHVQELVPYPRVRPRSEYEGTFRETDVMVKFAKEYGFSDVTVESFPSQGRLWQPTHGELWMVEPEVRKLYDIYDVAVSLAGNSESGDVTAEVVDVGIGGRTEDYAGKDLTGKIVLGSAGAGTLQRNGVFEKGAVGVVSYTSLRRDDYPDQVMSSGISANAPEGKKPGFGWVVSPRVGRELSDLLASGRKVVLRSIVRAETFPGELEVVSATIPGDGSSDQEIAISAHLYEGYIKQGANDDASGCALTLEMGRTYIRLVKEGKLPAPKRTIRFLWVPEISGTIAWMAKHEDIKKRIVADLNFDMEGLRLSASRSTWVLHRTPNSFPTFLNDLAQSVMEWVAETNRERVRFRSGGYGYTLPIVSPNGSMDPFLITIDKHYGASDHVIYLQNGIPSVMFITWPDMWYHSSQDVPEKLDPTQFRRAAVVGTACMSFLASAGDDEGLTMAGESAARGTERMGSAQRKGMGYLADAPDGASLATAYKEAKIAVRHQAQVERDVVSSASVLFAKPDEARKRLRPLVERVDEREEALHAELAAYYRLQAEHHKVKASEPSLTAEEKAASKLVVERVGAQGGFGGGRGAAARASLSDQERADLQRVPQHMTAELNILIGKKLTVLEIRDFLSGEFEPLPLADLMAYLKVMEKMGSVKVSQRG